jgi:3-deoxy-manno-octulosonate cytidylyltransferase (CMP-KDO synthetase)
VDRVVVATDHSSVAEAVAPLGVEPVMTSTAHRSGTERVAEVAAMDRFRDADVIVNVQGDEPFFPLDAASGAIARVRDREPIGTAGAPLRAEDVTDVNRVKVVVDHRGRAVRFSRVFPASAAWACDVDVLHHVGVYAYTRSALLRWVCMAAVPEEHTTQLEQLRPLHHGVAVGVARVAGAPAPSVDTEQDLENAESYLVTSSQKGAR